jgi:hypothetical protein
MEVKIDSVIYNLDLKKVSDHLKNWWIVNKNTLNTIKTDNGKTIDFSSKSLARIGFKTLMTPVLIPMVHMLYGFKKITPPLKEKHEDLLDYVTVALINFIAALDGDKIYVESLAVPNGNSRRISSIATYEPEKQPTDGRDEQSGENTEVSTRGETRIPSWTLRNGQDVSDESSDQEESGDTAMAERLPP